MSNRPEASAGNGFVEIRADAERAVSGSGEHDHMHPIVAPSVGKGAPEILVHGQRQRVELFRPCEADGGDCTVIRHIDCHVR